MLTALIPKYGTLSNHKGGSPKCSQHEIQKYKAPFINIQMQCCSNPQCDFSTKRSLSHSYTNSKPINEDTTTFVKPAFILRLTH